MPESSDQAAREGRLTLAIVLSTTEGAGTVDAQSHPTSAANTSFLPRPRAARVAPGHLVALAVGPDGSDVVEWRWFDADAETDDLQRFLTAHDLWDRLP